MYSFNMNSNCTASSSARCEEACFACAQGSVVFSAILTGISVLMSVFAIIGILNIERIGLALFGLISLIILALSLCLITAKPNTPYGLKLIFE